MRPMTLGEVAKAVGCTEEYFLNHKGKITSVSTDSRPQPEDEDKDSCLFVALRGEIFDGHQYVGAALRNKARYALVDQRGVEEFCADIPKEQLIVCQDTERGFLDLAAYYRSKFQFRMVAVTGSAGKTTTKEMIAQVLSAQYETMKTQGNLNNRVGLPKTLLTLDETVQAAVVEMGMNHFGEISDLTRCAKPDAAVITNIGEAHIEYLGSREGILKAKMEIIEGMKPGSPLILNGDDDLLAGLECPQMKKIYYGIDSESCEVRGKEIHEENGRTTFTIVSEGQEYPAMIPTFGRHNVLDALAAFAVGREFGMQPPVILDALTHYKPSGMRQRVVHRKDICVVEDCYNAAPDSMNAALDTLSGMECEGRKICVFADMRELGSASDESHRAIGQHAARVADKLLVYGPQSHLYVEGANAAGLSDAREYPDRPALTQAVREAVRPGDIVWFKGSLLMNLEEVLRAVFPDAE